MQYLLLPFYFLKWYFTELPLKLLRFFLNFNLFFEDRLAIRLHTRLFFVPLFHDTTIIGRVASVVFRTIRIFGGIWVLLFVNIVLACVLPLWFLLPIAPFITRYAIIAWPVLIVLYAYYIFNKPARWLSTKLSNKDVPKTTTTAFRALLPLLRKKPYMFYDKFAKSEEGQNFFVRLNVDRNALLLNLYKQNVLAIPQTQKLFEHAKRVALTCHALSIDSMHLFVALTNPSFPHAQMLKDLGISAQLALQTAQWLSEEQVRRWIVYLWDDDYYIQRLGGVNRGWLGVPTPTLNLYSTDITELAARGRLPEIVGRENFIDQIVQVLAKSDRENILLLGESGNGKTSIIYKIAQRIIEGGVPKPLFSKRVVRLDSGSLVAGANAQGTLEARLKKIMEEIKATGNVILFLDDIHTFTSISSAQGNLDVFNFLKPYASSADLQLIGATSYENFERYVLPNQDFVRLFQKIEIPTATKEETTKILEIEASHLEKKHGVVITYPALAKAVTLSERYMHDSVLPGKAIDLLDEGCVAALAGGKQLVLPEHLETLVEQKTHIPVHDANKRERDVLLNLEAKLHERLIGQNEAVVAVANALRRARSGIHESDRPIASFLFVGPTGVGKTELAKALAATYFGNEETMIRFDMSEYQEPMSVYRLIGSPQAMGSDPQPGRLTEAVREQPFALILLDELEKANPEIINLLLQVLDDGRLTDSAGRTVTFKDTIIIATSNAATLEIEQSMQMGKPVEQIQSELLGLLAGYFRIELLNRFDDIVLFRPLTQEHMIAITKLLLVELKKTLSQKGYTVDFSNEMIASLAQRGFNPLLGARPLRRLIQDEVESQIAKLILSEKLKKGQQIVLGPQYFPPQPFTV